MPGPAETQDYYIDAIDKVDSVLRVAAKTLVTVARCTTDENTREVWFTPWISEDAQPEDPHSRSVQAACSSTLERLLRSRRRFVWLKEPFLDKDCKSDDPSSLLKQLKELERCLCGSFQPEVGRVDFEKFWEFFKSNTFGNGNPLTASHVFRALLYEGRANIHAPVGILALFLMLWSLYRRFPHGHVTGARIEPWAPTAYVTAHCLTSIETLCWVCRRRADIYRDARSHVQALDQTITSLKAGPASESTHWDFVSRLDQLALSLFDLRKIGIGGTEFAECARDIEKEAGRLQISSSLPGVWERIKSMLLKSLEAAGEEFQKTADRALTITQEIERELVNKVKGVVDGDDEQFRALTGPKPGMVLVPPMEREKKKEYFTALSEAAQKAYDICKKSSAAMGHLATWCSDAKNKGIEAAFTELHKENRKFAENLQEVIDKSAEWCQSVLEREVAHASARDDTEFDPAELIYALAVTVLSTGGVTEAEIADAVQKAKRGAREDGSWSAGQPYYSSDPALGAYAVTSDIMRGLSGAIRKYPDVTVADDIFAKFVNWLETTKTSVLWKYDKDKDPINLEGWPSERSREHKRIDLWATALAADALLDIRHIWEYRLWQLCKARFNVVEVEKGLSEVDPVDLGAQHGSRLHQRLLRVARTIEADDEGTGSYSFVLHGPPGSSKTALAQALSNEMWRIIRHYEGELHPRLLRITPADFTQHGEDRIDSQARSIFELLGHVRGVTILFDEIDDLLHRRSHTAELRFMELVIPAMLNRLQDLRDRCPRQQISFLIATNYVENIEPSLLREGRIDEAIPVVYPDTPSRRRILQKEAEKLAKKIDEKEKEIGKGNSSVAEEIERLRKVLEILKQDNAIAEESYFFPWKTIRKLCKQFSESSTPSAGIPPIQEVLEKYRAHLAEPEYGKRMKDTPRCPELINEFVHHEFTRAANSNSDKLLHGLQEMLNDQGENHLESLGARILAQASRAWFEEGRSEAPDRSLATAHV